jgi:hypothetical protein
MFAYHTIVDFLFLSYPRSSISSKIGHPSCPSLLWQGHANGVICSAMRNVRYADSAQRADAIARVIGTSSISCFGTKTRRWREKRGRGVDRVGVLQRKC